MSRNKIVQDTDSDALLSKVSAESAGYYHDPLLKLFLPSNVDQGDVHKLPLFNRGTYVRVMAVSRLIDRFLLAPGTEKKQIISLGAGSDTRPFHLLPKHGSNLVYHELDFDVSARRKAGLVAKHAVLHSAVAGPVEYDIHTPEPPHRRRRRSPPWLFASSREPPSQSGAGPRHLHSSGGSSGGVNTPDIQERHSASPGRHPHESETPLKSPSYYIHGVDLRQLMTPASLQLPGIDFSLPTLLVSECCLCYLEPDVSDAVLAAFVKAFTTSASAASSSNQLGIVSYEPFSSDDQFGKVMIHNLAIRGISIPTMMAFPTLQAQVSRLRGLGFKATAAGDLKFVHDAWVEKDEMQRIDRLEMLDEREEFDLLVAHYGIYWGSTTPESDKADYRFAGTFEAWNEFRRQI
ncbi:S-adenosyl-L-methionine-dependent methyltransferase [Lipomyces orientalis]|uniref:S-adenosyl-L-methionine-dependent methyltransferase n=1 Tax=Lipomyces orientalis TaxID=1233043 RepID=A0ACC3TT92_9ASCO